MTRLLFFVSLFHTHFIWADKFHGFKTAAQMCFAAFSFHYGTWKMKDKTWESNGERYELTPEAGEPVVLERVYGTEN